MIEKIGKTPENYDLIIIGTPLWVLGPTPAIRTYMHKNNLTGKYVAFFCTYECFGVQKTCSKLIRMAPQATCVGTLGLSKSVLKKTGKAENKIVNWSTIIKSFVI